MCPKHHKSTGSPIISSKSVAKAQFVGEFSNLDNKVNINLPKQQMRGAGRAEADVLEADRRRRGNGKADARGEGRVSEIPGMGGALHRRSVVSEDSHSFRILFG